MDASMGSMTVHSLASGRSYEILLLSGANGDAEQVGARMTASTSSPVITETNCTLEYCLIAR